MRISIPNNRPAGMDQLRMGYAYEYSIYLLDAGLSWLAHWATRKGLGGWQTRYRLTGKISTPGGRGRPPTLKNYASDCGTVSETEFAVAAGNGDSSDGGSVAGDFI